MFHALLRLPLCGHARKAFQTLPQMRTQGTQGMASGCYNSVQTKTEQTAQRLSQNHASADKCLSNEALDNRAIISQRAGTTIALETSRRVQKNREAESSRHFKGMLEKGEGKLCCGQS
jgi:hypothetical protein